MASDPMTNYYIQYTDKVVAEGHPTETDVTNRVTKELVSRLGAEHNINDDAAPHTTITCTGFTLTTAGAASQLIVDSASTYDAEIILKENGVTKWTIENTASDDALRVKNANGASAVALSGLTTTTLSISGATSGSYGQLQALGNSAGNSGAYIDAGAYGTGDAYVRWLKDGAIRASLAVDGGSLDLYGYMNAADLWLQVSDTTRGVTLPGSGGLTVSGGALTLSGGNLALGANTLTTSNTGLVSNLNADRVDSYEASALLARSNHTGTQAVATLSDHTKATHDALNIDADTVDGLHASSFMTGYKVRVQYSGGTWSKTGGSSALTVTHQDAYGFRVNHSIGDTNYSIIAFPGYSAGGSSVAGIVWRAKTNTTFEIDLSSSYTPDLVDVVVVLD